ncbi:unnamed protein product [Closterium sp. Naga37s-1]|nr:unnamed protein product [Closterium sp. Naga37s-1]
MPAEEREGEREVAPDALGGENAASGEQDERREQGASGAQDELGSQGALGETDDSRVQNGLEGQGALLGQDAAKGEGINPLDPVLPPSHPCANFTLPPPSTDRKRTGPRPCPVCYLPLPDAMGMRPSRGHTEEPILKHLAYVTEDDASERAARRAGNRPRFNGHQSLQQREDSFKIQESMRVHCGFVWGGKVGNGTGFDVSDDDRRFMERCYDIVVVSAIFGAYDVVQQPSNISEEARQQLCFVMFVDETTFNEFIRDGTLKQPRTRRVGLWRLVVVHNPPYRDPRRTGKIPKLLIHRLFPNVQFSMWVDAKLQLVQDPYMILERFLWRGNFSWAISKHYKRFDVFVEAEANKAAGKYRNASIDEQMKVYRSDGMTPFSEDKMPIISDVPEGCVIMREHTALSNLMACLWFNEVDRFTSRDQLSFGYTRDKICRSVPAWRLNMFLDCERRNFVVQGYHKDVLIQKLNGSSTAPALVLPTTSATPALTAAAAADGAGAGAGASGSFAAASGAAADSDPNSAAATGDVFLREEQRQEGYREQLQQQEGQHLNEGEKVEEGEEDSEEQEQERSKIERRLLGCGEEGGWEREGGKSRRKRDFGARDIRWDEEWKDVDIVSGLQGEGNGLTRETST